MTRASSVAALRKIRGAVFVFAVPLLLAGCPKAGTVKNGVFEAPGAWRLGVPGDDWELHRNYRWGSRRVVDFKRKGVDVDIRVSISPIPDDSRRIPLDVLADTMTANYGRGRGMQTEVQTIQRVDFGAHEGVVVYSTRKADLVVRQLAQAYVRAGNRLVILSYIAPPERYADFVEDYEAAVSRFAVLLPADAPEIGIKLPEDLPEK